MQKPNWRVRRLVAIVWLLALPAAHAQDSLVGSMHYHKAEVILREHEKAGKPRTEEARQQLLRASGHIDDAVEAAPRDAGLWYRKGQFHQHYLIDSEAALAAYQESYRLSPHPRTAASIADVATGLGEYQEAILLLKSVLREAPANNQMTFALSAKLIAAYLLDGQHEQAGQVADQLETQDHSLHTRALLVLTRAMNDNVYDAPPGNLAELYEELWGLYQMILRDDPILTLLDGRPWAMGFEDENERQYVRDYFLPDESPQRWTERVSLQILKDDDEPPARYLSGYRKYLKGACDGFDWKKLKVADSSDSPAAAAEWRAAEPCNGIPHQYEVTRVVQFRENMLARIVFSSRAPETGQQEQWRALITDMPLAETLTGGKRSAEGH